MKKPTLRKRSQREVSLKGKCCEQCGKTERLQRHHPSYTSTACVILCQVCHKNLHLEDGSWGRGSKALKDCVICGRPFTPNHSKKHKTCSKDCLSELGRLNARKRWDR